MAQLCVSPSVTVYTVYTLPDALTTRGWSSGMHAWHTDVLYCMGCLHCCCSSLLFHKTYHFVPIWMQRGNAPYICVLFPYSMYIAPDDYTAVSLQHLTFTSAPSQMCITVNISEDEVVEPTESFTVTLSSSDPAVQQSLPSSTSVTINDSTSKCLPSDCSSCHEAKNHCSIAHTHLYVIVLSTIGVTLLT